MKYFSQILILFFIAITPGKSEESVSKAVENTESQPSGFRRFKTEKEAVEFIKLKLGSAKLEAIRDIYSNLDIESSGEMTPEKQKTEDSYQRFLKSAGPLQEIDALYAPKIGSLHQRVALILTYQEGILFLDIWLSTAPDGWYLSQFNVHFSGMPGEILDAISPVFYRDLDVVGTSAKIPEKEVDLGQIGEKRRFKNLNEGIEFYRQRLFKSEISKMYDFFLNFDLVSADEDILLKKQTAEFEPKYEGFKKLAGVRFKVAALVPPRLGENYQRVGYLLSYPNGIVFLDCWFYKAFDGWYAYSITVDFSTNVPEKLSQIPDVFYLK